MFSSSTVSRIGILTYFSNTVRKCNPWSSSHSAAIFRIRRTPRLCNSATCSGVVSSGPRNKKLGRIVLIANSGNGSSVVGGSSGRAVAGGSPKPRAKLKPFAPLGVPGVCGGVKYAVGNSSLPEIGEERLQGVEGDGAVGCGEGGARAVEDFRGMVRTWSLRRSADFVSSLRRLGAEGRRGGGGGRRKPACEGGGDGVVLTIFMGWLGSAEEDIMEDMRGSGERGGWEELRLRVARVEARLEDDLISMEERLSISGRVLERKAALVSSWKSPLLPPWSSPPDRINVSRSG
jgi:hypothetical protein